MFTVHDNLVWIICMMKKKNKPGEPLSEAETRIKIFSDCRNKYGPEAERQLRMVFDKWDGLLKQCTNEEERKHIKIMAITEIHTMMNYAGGLSIDGKVIIDDLKS